MDDEKLKDYFQSLRGAVLQGDFSAISQRFTLPLVVYSVAGVTLVRDEEELLRMFELYRSALMASQVANTETTIENVDQSNHGRRRVCVRFIDTDADGNGVTSSLIRYFLVNTPDGCKIEMMEYLESPIPLDEIKRIVH
ncbi:MAG: hypothetical protein QNJ20_15675 [Paracoccaceae bacterium]|nr:hypothetical protein [Paracoccaceae bacterium]